MSDVKNSNEENEMKATGAKKSYSWYNWPKKKGRFLLGTSVAVLAFGFYMQQPSAELVHDSAGVASFIKCSSSLNMNDVDEQSCRDYFESYLKKRITDTNNLPKIVPIDVIGNTYKLTQKAFAEKGIKPMEKLDVITNQKLEILSSGKLTHNSNV